MIYLERKQNMNNSFTKIFLIRLKNELQLAKLDDKNRNNKMHAWVTIVGYCTVLILVMFYFLSLPAQMNRTFQLDKVNIYIVSLLFWILGIWSLLSGVKNMIIGTDHDQLFVLPIEEWQAKLMNIFSLYFIYFCLCCLVLFSVQIPLYYFHPFPLINLITIILFSILIPLLAIGLSVIISLITKIILFRINFKNTIIEAGFNLCVFISPLIYGYYGNFSDTKSGFINSSLLSISLLDKISGEYWIKIFCKFVLLIAIFYCLCTFIVKYNKNWSELLVMQSKNTENFTLKIQKKFITIFKKEIKRYFSSFTYVINTTISPIALVILCGALLLGMLPNLQKIGISQLDLTINSSSIYFIMMIACLTLTTTTSSSLSFEGKNVWIIQSLPISVFELSLAKVLVNITLYVPGLIMTILVCWNTFLLRGFSLTITTFFLIINLFCISILGILLNLIFPNFTWTSEMVVVKQGLSTILTAVISLSFISLTSIFFLLFGTMGLGILALVELLISVISITYILKINYISME